MGSETQRKRWCRRGFAKRAGILVGVIVLLLIAFAFMTKRDEQKKEELASQNEPRISYVNVITVGQNDDNPISLTYSGVVRARYEASVAFQVGGRIIERKVDKGDVVKKGELMMRLDPVDLNLAVEKAEASVAASEADLTLATTNLKRYKDLYAKDAVSKLDLDTHQNHFEVATSALNSSKTALHEAKQRLSYATLKAETDGVISARTGEVGQVVAAGEEVMRMERSSEKEIEIDVPEQRIGLFRNPPKDVGGQIQVTFWAYPDLKLNAKIREVAPQADSATRTYPVRLSLDNLPPEIQSGMTANVVASALASTDVVVIPITAIMQTADTPTVWLLEGDTIRKHDVKLGSFIGPNDVEVLSGLKHGDEVVVKGIHLLSEGMKARKWEGPSQ